MDSRHGSASVQLLAVAVSAIVCLMMGLQVARFQPTSASPTSGAPLDQSTVETQSAAESSATDATTTDKPAWRRERIRGRVVWLAQALQDDFAISTVPEVEENVLALHTKDGRLLPLVENLRGRAFRKDERLREKDLELLVRSYDRHPYLQVLRMYEVDDGQLYEVDYWCDVCAIIMYETGPCACCQDHNRLRRRPVDAAAAD